MRPASPFAIHPGSSSVWLFVVPRRLLQDPAPLRSRVRRRRVGYVGSDSAVVPPHRIPAVFYEESVADRRPRPRLLGPHVGHELDPFSLRRYHYEGTAERRNLIALLADPDVVELREQVKVVYVDRYGDRRTHCLDLLVILRDGTRRARSVKRAGRGAAHAEEFSQVAAGAENLDADEFVILTDHDVTDAELCNAQQVLASGREHDAVAQRAVREACGRLPARVTLREVAVASGLSKRGYRAALVLFKTGELKLACGDEIAPGLEVANRLHQPVR